MRALEPLILPDDVVVIAVADLSPGDLEGADATQGDYCVTRPHTRTVTVIVDADTAALLSHFRAPATIVDAVIDYCRDAGRDADDTLDLAFDALSTLVREGLLVPARSPHAQPVGASLPYGTRVAEAAIVEPVHVLADTEVYLGRRPDGEHVAVKIAGNAPSREAIAALRHETAVLQLLDGSVSPRLVEAGRHRGRDYVATDWRIGSDLYAVAADARALHADDARDELLRTSEGVLDAYARLHAQGVLHGDVQPRNVLVGAGGNVTLIDFGLAGLPRYGLCDCRGGVEIFQAPEIVRAAGDGEGRGRLTVAAEVYAVAALLHWLLTGRHTHAFSLQRDEMRRQIIDDSPLSFEECGATDLPTVGSCLRTALAKDPSKRPASVAELLIALRGAAARDLRRPDRVRRRLPADGLLTDLLDATRDGDLFSRGLAPPTASVTYGAAGIAYALLRIARVRADESLLAAADEWSTRAVADLASDAGVWSAELEITPDTFGRASLFHHASGVHCVDALVAHARHDDAAQLRALEAFIAASAGSDHADIAFGEAGLLLGCALLVDALRRSLDVAPLIALGERLMSSAWCHVDCAVGEGSRLLGAAHGRAGCLFAVLRWCEASGCDPPAGLGARLEELAALGEPDGRGRRWPRELSEPAAESPLIASWCNGAAGHAELWTLANRVLHEPHWGQLADEAAWGAWQAPTDVRGDLCCGLAGRAYALLSRYRDTADTLWLARARNLARQALERPAIDDPRRYSLYHGLPGIAVLAADLELPEYAAMPLFEAEGWSA